MSASFAGRTSPRGRAPRPHGKTITCCAAEIGKRDERRRDEADGLDRAPCNKKCCKHSRTGWSARLGASTKNESEADVVASQSCSQSAAEPLVLSILGLSIRPRQRRV